MWAIIERRDMNININALPKLSVVQGNYQIIIEILKFLFRIYWSDFFFESNYIATKLRQIWMAGHRVREIKCKEWLTN